MHCPKCGSFYAEGAQRFCDTDGARLVSDTPPDPKRSGRTGVFSTLLPISSIDAAREDAKYAARERDDRAIDATMESMFFETEEDDAEDFRIAVEPAVATAITELPERPAARKIDPYTIPAGHADYQTSGEMPPNVLDFDPDHPDDMVGRTIKGRYKIVELVNEDDTGFQYLAEDRLADGRNVSIRILTGEDMDEVTRSIFAEERVSLSHLNHPNVVRLFDSGEFVDATTYLISEHIDALSALDILQIHGALDPVRTGRIIRQAGTALSDVHNEGILHRDLRPEFLLLETDGETETVKISDFGVSDGEPNSENLAYRSPESLNGQIPTVVSDIYSLGVIAFELLTDHSPFVANAPREMFRTQRNGLLANASHYRPELTPSVDAVLAKALAFDPLARYATAREFGDAISHALSNLPVALPAVPADRQLPEVLVGHDSIVGNEPKVNVKEAAIVKAPNAAVAAVAATAPATNDDLWTRRSPEPLNEPNSGWLKIAGIGFLAMLVIAVGVWYYILNRTVTPEISVPQQTGPVAGDSGDPQSAQDIEVAPLPRTITQPPNTAYYQSNKQNLKGDLVRNFVGFSLYYPLDWKSGGSHESTEPNTRGKFVDIAKTTPDGKLREQMLISYYPSAGTYNLDAAKFPQMVKEANETLKKLIPDYQMVSSGEIKINGGWRAYEVKFQGGAKSETGERFIVWGRRLFIPAASLSARNGYEITMLATSFADDVRSVDDVGVRGELGSILDTFEPSQSF